MAEEKKDFSRKGGYQGGFGITLFCHSRQRKIGNLTLVKA
jgi:hypothetical protein